MCETYNGWTNRETWALNLWLSNDEGLYEMTRERVAEALGDAVNVWKDGSDDRAPRIAGEAVKDLWDELTDVQELILPADEIISMVKDVGSDYRVDWDAIGAHWLADVSES